MGLIFSEGWYILVILGFAMGFCFAVSLILFLEFIICVRCCRHDEESQPMQPSHSLRHGTNNAVTRGRRQETLPSVTSPPSNRRHNFSSAPSSFNIMPSVHHYGTSELAGSRENIEMYGCTSSVRGRDITSRRLQEQIQKAQLKRHQRQGLRTTSTVVAVTHGHRLSLSPDTLPPLEIQLTDSDQTASDNQDKFDQQRLQTFRHPANTTTVNRRRRTSRLLSNPIYEYETILESSDNNADGGGEESGGGGGEEGDGIKQGKVATEGAVAMVQDNDDDDVVTQEERDLTALLLQTTNDGDDDHEEQDGGETIYVNQPPPPQPPKLKSIKGNNKKN